jgi:5'-nucleotidase
MNILITNDDGWGFEGIQALESVASQFGDTWTVAPLEPMSGISHQLTFERPMSLIEKAPQSFALDGTPADCVRVAMTQLGVEFDWVFSGINRGANLGSDIFVSGTVAAVREASLFQCNGIAFSQHLRNFKAPFEWSRPTRMAERLIPQLLARDLRSGTWINVNFPDVENENGDEVLFVEPELDRNPLPADYLKLDDGKLLYNSVYNDRVRTPGHDADVCFSGNVSITFH